MLQKLNVAFLPIYPNPYQHLLTAALQQCNIVVEHLDGLPSVSWLWQRRKQVKLLHFHWLYGLYMRHYLTPFRYVGFISRFLLAQRLGYKIVWTAHNIVPHRMPFARMHLAVRKMVMARADAVIAHCNYGRDELLRRFPRQKPIYIVPIGSYANVYPLTVTRDDARARLKINQAQFMYLFLGNIESRKGLETFVDLFQAQAAETDVAIIAGRNRDVALVQRLEKVAAEDKRIKVHADFIPDDEIQLFLRAADVMVAPFEKILTSSSVMVGLSYGLPVIVPDLGCLPELVSPEAGIVYKANNNESLGDALHKIKSMNLNQMGTAAKAISDSLRWDDIAQQTANIYRTCIEATT